ncbi:hypothetical protein C9374_006531 [Naegleria lovaniensis]|uniref:Uncharacterized protein n=1 Tax=Naegleria lovaniensis TaxID=51637 RepID=A0AA88KHV6_NAELO|nr:uncharacterized protein C9374_006531 [Naegleria lovaniensis]KAG2381542.1 hypothetical protein C9374_006531 [Naegleria lovaniensis]
MSQKQLRQAELSSSDDDDAGTDTDDDDDQLFCFLKRPCASSKHNSRMDHKPSNDNCEKGNTKKFTMKDILTPSEFLVRSNSQQYAVPSNEVPHLLTALLKIVNNPNKTQSREELKQLAEVFE